MDIVNSIKQHHFVYTIVTPVFYRIMRFDLV